MTGNNKISAYYPNTDDATKDNCSFMFGYDFENFQDQSLISGLDMSAQGMPVNLRCNITGSTNPTILTTFVYSDYIYTLTSDGVLSVSN